MTIHPLKQIDHDAAAGDDPASTAALGKEDKMLRSLDITKSKFKPLSALPRVSLSVFLENVPKSATKTKLPQCIEKADQLVYCNSLMLLESLALSSSEQEPPLGNAELAWLTWG